MSTGEWVLRVVDEADPIDGEHAVRIRPRPHGHYEMQVLSVLTVIDGVVQFVTEADGDIMTADPDAAEIALTGDISLYSDGSIRDVMVSAPTGLQLYHRDSMRQIAVAYELAIDMAREHMRGMDVL